MEQAKAAVSNLLNKSGKHDTEVHESVNPAVTSETIKPHRHEETTQAVDREVHQDHYHTTVQPLEHKEVLPEKHSHQMAPVQEREIRHGDDSHIKQSIEKEAAKFGNTSTTHETTHSTSQAPVAAGEHVHHHVHETVQPVIHKETVQPEVVHTTIPIHETHHAQAEHHGMSTLPTKTLSEFKELGGQVTGAGHRHEEYEGHPRPYNPSLQEAQHAVDKDPKSHDGLHGTHGTHTGTSSNVSGSGADYSSGPGYTAGGVGSTGTALGGRTEGNTASRALDAATSHGSTGHTGTTGTSGYGSHDTSSRGHETSTTGHSSTGGVTSHGHGDRDTTDTSHSTEKPEPVSTKHKDDVQSPSQGRDPNLVEDESSKSKGLTGQGVDGSHSAVFGLTPDGHKHDDTSTESTKLRPAHTKEKKDDDYDTGDTGSRAPMGSGVAEQMHDPRVSEGAHGKEVSNTGSEKIGAGAPGGSQGFGNVRPEEHGGTTKIENKVDPTTDADGDGKRGVMD